MQRLDIAHLMSIELQRLLGLSKNIKLLKFVSKNKKLAKFFVQKNIKTLTLGPC